MSMTSRDTLGIYIIFNSTTCKCLLFKKKYNEVILNYSMDLNYNQPIFFLKYFYCFRLKKL